MALRHRWPVRRLLTRRGDPCDSRPGWPTFWEMTRSSTFSRWGGWVVASSYRTGRRRPSRGGERLSHGRRYCDPRTPPPSAAAKPRPQKCLPTRQIRPVRCPTSACLPTAAHLSIGPRPPSRAPDRQGVRAVPRADRARPRPWPRRHGDLAGPGRSALLPGPVRQRAPPCAEGTRPARA